MNAVDAVEIFEQYYGPYPNDFLRGVVTAYLQEKKDEHVSLNRLIQWTVGTYSNRWKTPPDVATLEDAIKARKKWIRDHDSYGNGLGALPNEPVFLPMPGQKRLTEER